MHFDGTITLGTILSAVVMLISVSAILLRMGALQQVIEEHGRALEKGSIRMDRHDQILLELVGDVRELIGRNRAGGSLSQ